MLVTFLVFAVVLALVLMALGVYLAPSSRRGVSTVHGLDPTDEATGNLADIASAGSFHDFLLSLHERFGEIASFWFGTQFCVSVASTKLIRETQGYFEKPALFSEPLGLVCDHRGLSFLQGPKARHRHGLLTRVFSRKKCLQLMPAFREISEQLGNNWLALPPDEHIPLFEYMMALSVKMITSTQMGGYFRHNDNNTREFQRVYELVVHDLNALSNGDDSLLSDQSRKRTFEKNVEKFRNALKQVVREQEQSRSANPAPLLDGLLDNLEDEDELVSDLASVVLASFHHLGNFLTWTLYYLVTHPDVQDRVADEISLVGDLQKEEDVDKLPYTCQVLQEVLRLVPLTPYTSRVESERDVRVGGHLIHKATPIVQALGVAANREEGVEEPGRFDPDHFSPSTPVLPDFMAFGVGSRRCPGALGLATLPVLAALAVLLNRFRIRPAAPSGDDADVDDADMIQPKFGFVTQPEEEVWVRVEKR